MAIQNVAIIGASGNLGRAILTELRESFTVTVLLRQSSSFKDTSINVRRLSDSMAEDEVAKALEGQDALIISMEPNDIEQQKSFVRAAAKAGVKRYVPGDFGSCDSTLPRCQELYPLYQRKQEILKWIQEYIADKPSMSWTAIVSGHFFDWGLTHGFLHADIKNGTMDLLDDGEARFSTSTLKQIGRAVVKTLQKEDETKNQVLYIHSFCVSMLDVLDALRAASGMSYTVSFLKSEEMIQKYKDGAAKGEHEASEEIVYVLGNLYTNWESYPDFANKKLGLEEENLDEVIKQVLMSTAK